MEINAISEQEKTATQTGSESNPEGMVWIPGGVFKMGSDKHYKDEAPVQTVIARPRAFRK